MSHCGEFHVLHATLLNFSMFFYSADFFTKKLFEKKIHRNTVKVSSNMEPHIRLDVMSGLPWVQTVCKGQSADDTCRQIVLSLRDENFKIITRSLLKLSPKNTNHD